MSGLRATVGNVMSTKIFSVEMDEPIKSLFRIFEHVKFHHVPVLDKGNLVGLVSEGELLRVISPMMSSDLDKNATQSSNMKIHQVMNRKPITIFQDDSIRSAIEILLENDIECLPVVTRTGELKGMLSWKDVLRKAIKTSSSEKD